MRGGLDDALDKLARRDELRRRASGEATGAPPAVTELVEAIAAVVARHPHLGVTVGVEGSGDPLLLRFFSEDGVVQVNADTPVAARAAAEASPRHADFDLEPEEPAEGPFQAPPAYPAAPDDGGATQRLSRDDQDRYGPPPYGYDQNPSYYAESDTAERRYGNFDGPPAAQDARYVTHDPGETSRDLGARMRDLGMASRDPVSPSPAYQPHPFAATPPPPVPPQTTRRINPEQYRPPAEPSAAERAPQAGQQQRGQQPGPGQPGPGQAGPGQTGPGQPGGQQQPTPQSEMRGMPAPLPTPIPLQVERPEQTEMAARRLAALLRDDPSLLNQTPD